MRRGGNGIGTREVDDIEASGYFALLFLFLFLHRRELDRNAYYTWVYGLEAALVTLSCIGQNIHADDPLEDLLILLV